MESGPLRCSTLAPLAQVGAIAAMHEKEHGPPVIRFGPFTLDGRSGELRNGPTRLKVPDQSIAVLQSLLERPGQLVTREALRDRLWAPDTFVDFEAGLNAAVRRLREALNDSADVPRYIETLPRRGYRFIAPVDGTLSDPAASASAEATAGKLVGAEAPVSGHSETARAGRVRLRHVVLVALGLTAVGAALWAGLRWRNAAPAPARPVPITRFQGLEVDPAISPDGKLVAFAWDGGAGDNYDIYVQSIDGSSPLQLTKDAAADHAPAWSPDGQRIAFVRVLEGKREIVVLPVLGGPERVLFEAAAERDGLDVGWGSHGLSWTPDGKHLVFGDQSGPASNSAIYLYSFEDGEKRQLTHPPANLSDSHPVVSPNGRYLAFVRVNRDPSAVLRNVLLQKLEQLHVSGEPTPVTSGLRVIGFDWCARQPQYHPRLRQPRARIVANRRRRRRARALVANHHGDQALGGTLRCWRGLSEHAHQRDYLGIAHALLPESRTLRGPNFSRYRVDGFRYRYAVLTGWNADRVRVGKVGPQRDMGVEPRRISGEQTDKLRGRRASEAGGKPCLECRRQADRLRHSRDDHWQMESPHRGRRRWWPRQAADVRRLQQQPAELVY